jgi:hypothetical protein
MGPRISTMVQTLCYSNTVLSNISVPIQFKFVLCLAQGDCQKAAHQMFVKLTTVLRICDSNEKPADTFCYWTGPIAIGLLLIRKVIKI